MTVTLNHRNFEETERVIAEMELLTSKNGPFTARESARNAFLLAKLASLRDNVPVSELKAFEEDRLRKLAGLPANVSLRCDPEKNAAWRAFLRDGETRGCELPMEFRDNLAGSQSILATNGPGGGYFVPVGYHSELIQSLPTFDEILDPAYSHQWDDATGQPIAVPAIDDLIGSPLSFNKSTIQAEVTQSTETDVIAASVQFPTCPTFKSGRLFFSFELTEDSPILGTALEMAIARRHSLGIGGYFITGTNTATQPQGLTNNLPASTVITSATSTLSLTDFEAVYAAVSPAYIKGCVWYMADSTRALVTKLLEAANRPMIGPTYQLLNRPIAVCNSMNTPSAGVTAVAVLANKDYIYQRFVPKATAIRRYVQTPGYVEYGIMGVEGYTRADQRLLLFTSAIPPVASLNVHS
jgi:HK97 family phage major capsid protein